MGFSVFIVV